ncbi:hypothetical protein HMPREF0972_00243 [Actinomyces sp. oral taxon 848 str. F0332]|nr:hypothetical protein HMPREF0972_00243 [Actinomyces sp. oral taxon 848 str. F0332]
MPSGRRFRPLAAAPGQVAVRRNFRLLAVMLRHPRGRALPAAAATPSRDTPLSPFSRRV